MVYILAEFDLTVEIVDKVVKIKKDEMFMLSSLFNIKIKVKPTDNVYLEEYEILVSHLNAQKSEYYDIREFSKGYLVVLKPKRRLFQTNYFEEELSLPKTEIKIRYFKQSYGIIQVFFKNIKYEFKWGNDLQSLNCFTKKIADKRFAFIEINSNKKYCFIFSETKLIYEGYIKEINETANELLLLADEHNCYGQKTVHKISVKADKQEKYLVYYDEREVNKSFDIRYLFLDGVLLGSSELALPYLSSELKLLDFNLLSSYFENFDDYIFVEDNCLLKKNTEVFKIVHFDISNNLITNIYD